MKIIPLSECPEFAEVCAAWSFGEWTSQIKGHTLSDSIKRYKDTAQNMGHSLPKTWVAVIDRRPAGMVSLKETEHEDREDLSPWLGSLFVHSSYRNQGIAGKLCVHIFREAKRSGFDKVYLFTHSAAAYYKRLGFEKIGTVRDPSGKHKDGETLMCRNLK